MTHLCHVTQIWKEQKCFQCHTFIVNFMTNPVCHITTTSLHCHFQLRGIPDGDLEEIFGIFYLLLHFWILRDERSNMAKKGHCMTSYAFFSWMTHVYQIFTYTGLYTRIFSFRYFCDFHMPFVYQNSYIPTTYQYFWCIPIVYRIEKLPFLFYAAVRHFLVDTSKDLVIYTEWMCMEVCKFSL